MAGIAWKGSGLREVIGDALGNLADVLIALCHRRHCFTEPFAHCQTSSAVHAVRTGEAGFCAVLSDQLQHHEGIAWTFTDLRQSCQNDGKL